MNPTVTENMDSPSTDTAAPMLAIRHLRKVYEGSGRTVEAIGDVNFNVKQGELVCIVGPSGAGKTTLLRCIAGLLAPTTGEILLSGKAVSGPSRGMAVVFQEYARSLFPWMRVAENIELPLKEKGKPLAERRRLVAESLEAVGLRDSGGAYPWQLSGGMQQRVAIARAIAYEPQVLLMDKPFASVDAQTRAELEDLVRSIWARLGMTIVFVTHDIDESVYLGDRVVVLSASPTTVMQDVPIDLGRTRNQLTTRSEPRFGELRSQIYTLIRDAKHATQ
ncbi:NitT/TauT family transport system ATP-binding protein OS=Castellaniella defragrans OX=75697 GN=HNR28_000909 PE=4 SV=1 [Castellaniella defragrans]